MTRSLVHARASGWLRDDPVHLGLPAGEHANGKNDTSEEHGDAGCLHHGWPTCKDNKSADYKAKAVSETISCAASATGRVPDATFPSPYYAHRCHQCQRRLLQIEEPPRFPNRNRASEAAKVPPQSAPSAAIADTPATTAWLMPDAGSILAMHAHFEVHLASKRRPFRRGHGAGREPLS